MKKILARVGLVQKTCSMCKHFDLDAGQHGIAASSPAFAAAATVLSPEQIAATAMTDEERAAEVAHILATEAAIEEGKTPPAMPEILVAFQQRAAALTKTPEPLPWKVSEFGTCAKRPTEAVWSGWKCEMWS